MTGSEIYWDVGQPQAFPKAYISLRARAEKGFVEDCDRTTTGDLRE